MLLTNRLARAGRGSAGSGAPIPVGSGSTRRRFWLLWLSCLSGHRRRSHPTWPADIVIVQFRQPEIAEERHMCMSCGCGEPNERHKQGDITLDDLKTAAGNHDLEVEQTADNIHDLARDMKQSGQIT